MIWDIDFIFGIWVYYDFPIQLELCRPLTKFIGLTRVNLICSSSLYTHMPNIKSISLSMAKKVVTTKYLAFISLWFEILTLFLAYECIMMSYRSSVHFVPVQWFLDEICPLDFEIYLVLSPVLDSIYLLFILFLFPSVKISHTAWTL
jgi:hypothetical protein